MTFLFILVSLAGSRGLAVSYFALLRMSCSFYYFQSVSAGIEHPVSVWIIPQIDHSFNKCLLSAHRVPGAVHSAGVTVGTKTGTGTEFTELPCSGETNIKEAPQVNI